jgi:hypothetical protein
LPNLAGGANKYGSNKTLTAQMWALRACSAPTTFRGKSDAKLPIPKGHQTRYVQECDLLQRVPIPLPYITGHSRRFEASGRDLVNKELLTIAGMMSSDMELEVADLSSNSLLTDVGLVPFLEKLSRRPMVTGLQKLLLSNCVRAGGETMEGIMRLLASASCLKVLDLSRVPLSTRLQGPLCRAIGEHNFLESVNLSDTNISSTFVTKQCVTDLLSSTCIKQLDLGWNCFSAETFFCLGEQLTKGSVIRQLRLPNCAAVGGTESPLSPFFECLSKETALQLLDLSMNRLDHNSCLILEDSLDKHPTIQELVISNNALGAFGIRSLLRLMSRETNKLATVNLDGCFNGSTQDERNEVRFAPGNAGGRYPLDLAKPSHRAVLRMLYRVVEKFGLQPEDAFTFSFTPGADKDAVKTFSHPQKDASGFRSVPTCGALNIVLNMQKCVERFKTLESENVDDFFGEYYERVRYCIGWKKVVPICGNWNLLKATSVATQQCFLDALAKDFAISVPMLKQICGRDSLLAKEAILRLSPSISYDGAARFMANLCSPSIGDYLWVHDRTQALVYFNQNITTGHYKLNLANCCDFAVAERLVLLDRWEAAIDVQRGNFDTSKYGNRSHFRNEFHRGQLLHHPGWSVAEWSLPESGEFEFDYNTNRRPTRKDAPVDTSLWDQILVSLYDSSLNRGPVMLVLRRISHYFMLASMSMRKILGFFKSQEDRAECFVMFFFRITDIYNAKIFSSRFSKQEEVVKLQDRLGYVSFFPFVQPENARFYLDFSQHDQRICFNVLLALSAKEKRENLREPRYWLADGTEDPLTSGIPGTWSALDKMPKEGKISCYYVCAPENRKFEPRKQNAEKYGYYTVDASEHDVMWWTGLLEVPEDVVTFMEWIISGEYDSSEAVFQKIDRGNLGEIVVKQFVDFLKQAGFERFAGPDEQERYKAVFRYLDPGGEGSVSKFEWGILDQLWREFDLSMREFVHFMVLAFGEELGYFGPSNVVFALLDHSGDGAISYDEFEVLEKWMGGGERPASRTATSESSSRPAASELGSRPGTRSSRDA